MTFLCCTNCAADKFLACYSLVAEGFIARLLLRTMFVNEEYTHWSDLLLTIEELACRQTSTHNSVSSHKFLY